METTTFNPESDNPPEKLSDLSDLSDLFDWVEYLVFSLSLLVSVLIGVYFGFIKKQTTTKEFLMANKSMKVLPVSFSIIATFISAITLLGNPTEMFNFGTQYYMVVVNFFLVTLATAYLYLPVFFKLEIVSTFAYLQMRFNKPTRNIASFIFIVQMTIYMSIVVLAPALALSQVTGMNVYGCVVAIFVVVIFYTSIGGILTVIWTDTFQVICMFVAIIAIVIKGSIDVGGFQAVWERAEAGGRIEFFNFDLDPRTRHTVWGLVIGGYATWLTVYGTNQAQVQRYLTVPTLRKAQTAIWINFVGLLIMVTLCSYVGLIIYAAYHDCNPLFVGKIKKTDQLVPLFVMEYMGKIKGFPGLFVAGIFSGALSTVSSGLNALAAITLEDFIKGLWFPNLSDSRATLITKGLSVLFGVLSFGFVLVAENLGGILQAAISIFGMTGGPLLGLFTLGMFFPWCRKQGALVGCLTGLTFIFWIGFGAQFAKGRGDIVIPMLNFTTDGCPANSTIIIPTLPTPKEGGIIELYKISYMWYSFIGCTTTILVGLIVSILTTKDMKGEIRRMNPDLISPQINKFIEYSVPSSIRKKVGWEIGYDYVYEGNPDKPEMGTTANGLDNPAFEMKTNSNYKPNSWNGARA